jgi:hypothetical protein
MMASSTALVAFHGEFMLPWMVSSPGKSYCRAAAHFHFNEFEQLGVVNHVALVQEHDDVWHANLTGQQDVLAVGHWAVSGEHTKMALSIRAAPVIMFSHSHRVVWQSTWA